MEHIAANRTVRAGIIAAQHGGTAKAAGTRDAMVDGTRDAMVDGVKTAKAAGAWAALCVRKGSTVLRTVIAAAALTAAGCVSPHQSTAADVGHAVWEDAAELVIQNTDTLTLRDIGLFLRCNDRFEEDSLTVRIAVTTPDSLRYEEPFLLAIVRRQTPAALMCEVDIPYRRRALFPRTGDYRIRITPSRTVRGIESVGIHLTKSE